MTETSPLFVAYSPPTQPPSQWVRGALSLGIKRLGREADHSPAPSVEITNEWRHTSTPPIRPSWRGAELKHGDKFTFTLPGLT